MEMASTPASHGNSNKNSNKSNGRQGGNNSSNSLIQQQLSEERPMCPFGPAWRIPADEEHLWGRGLLNMMMINKERALASLLRVRDANFVRDFQDFAERLKLKPVNYKALTSKKDIISVVDMIQTTLKGSVLSVQSLVWRTGRFRASVGVIQRWVRQRLAETRKVKTDLKIKWRQMETRARERIRSEIERRNALHFGDVVMAATSASAASGSASSASLAAAVARATSRHQSPDHSTLNDRAKSPFAQSHRSPQAAAAAAASSSSRHPSPSPPGPSSRHHHSPTSSATPPSMPSPGCGRKVKRRSPAEQRINDLLWSLLSDAWMDDDVMDAAIHRLLMHRRCRYVDCFRVWRATSLRDFRSRAETMNITRTAMKLLECAMSLRFPRIQFTMEGVSVDELAYHAVAHQMQFPVPRPSVPPARPFLQFMRRNIWEMGDEDEEQQSEGGSSSKKSEDGNDDDDHDHDGNKKSNSNNEHGDDNEGVTFGQAAEKSLDLTNCSFSPLIMVKRDPVALLPSQSMCFRKEKKEVSATINEALNTRDGDDDDSNNNEEDEEDQTLQRKGWTQEEIAELHEQRFVDPISMVRRQTVLPINELSGGISPPFNFYHALLSFNASKIYLYAFMKQAVSGRRVLLESQLHGKEPRQQCEEAIKIIRTWVFLRTVRALSSEEIVTLDITPRSRYAKDGSPVARVSSHDDRQNRSPANRARDVMRVSATVDHEELRVSPPRSVLHKLIKPDVAASTSHLSTLLSVEAVPGVTTEHEHVKPYESVFVPHGVSATDLSGSKSKKTTTTTPSRKKYSLSPASSSRKHLMTTDEMAKSLLSRVSPFRKAAAAASAAKSNEDTTTTDTSATATPSAVHLLSGAAVVAEAAAAKRRSSHAAADVDSTSNVSSTRASLQQQQQQQQQPQALSARTFPVNLAGLRALMPPPATAAVVSAPSYSARNSKKKQQQQQQHPVPPTEKRPVSARNPTQQQLQQQQQHQRQIGDDDDDVQEQQQQQHRGHQPHHSYINTSGFMCSEQEYLEREFKDRREWEKRYVAPIRLRKNGVNNRLFVASERRAHAVELRLKGGVPAKVEKWHPGE